MYKLDVAYLCFALGSLIGCLYCWLVQPWTVQRMEKLEAPDILMPTLQAYTYYEAYLIGVTVLDLVTMISNT